MNPNHNLAGTFLHKDIYKVAGYDRISREDGDGESNSIAVQRQMISDFVEQHPEMELVDFYEDDGFTGTNFNRPEFQRMLTDIDSGKVDTVIVKDLSRFGRSYIDAGAYLERIFPEKHIRFIAINDGIDNLKQEYDISLPIKNLMNETYARDISKKVQSAFKTKQKHGEFVGAFAGYGYAKDKKNHNKLVVDPEAAEVVKRIFEMFMEGCGKIRIAKILNEEGVPCPSEYKKQQGLNYKNCNRLKTTTYWTYATINRILQNEMYVGNMIQNRYFRTMHGKAQKLPENEWIIVKNTHEAIIDNDTWESVQRKLKATKKEIDFSSSEVNIFAGKIKCGDCGRSVVKTSWKKDGKANTYFTCGTYKRYGIKKCSPHTTRMELLEKIILSDLNKIIQSISNLGELIRENTMSAKNSQKDYRSQIIQIDREIDKIGADKLSSYQDYKDGILSKEDYLKYAKLCEDKIQKAQSNKENLMKKIENQQNTVDAYENPWITKLRETERIDKLDRDIVEEMIDTIYLYEDKKIKIVYNFSDELKILGV